MYVNARTRVYFKCILSWHSGIWSFEISNSEPLELSEYHSLSVGVCQALETLSCCFDDSMGQGDRR